MREGWTYKKLGEVGSFLRGKSIQKADFVEQGMPCIHYGQIHTKFGVSVNKHLSEIPLELYNKSIIASPGDVIIAITSEDLEGSCKSTAWLGDYDVAVSAHAAVYKHNFNPKFIAYYLRSNSFYIEKEKYARGFKVMEIKPTDIAQIPLPIPSLEVQKSIVAELDKINELISLKKAQLSDLDSLAQSIFYDMFGDPIENEKGWEVKELEEMCSCITKGTTPTTLGFSFTEKGINFVKVESFIDGHIDHSKLAHITYECNMALLRSQLRDEDLLICIAGATIGKMAVVDTSILPANTNQACAIVRLKDKNNLRFLHAFIALKLKEYVIQMGKGVAQPNLSLGQLRKLIIFCPPLSLQQEFAKRIELIEQQKAQISSTIKDLETLLASRMQYWFD